MGLPVVEQTSQSPELVMKSREHELKGGVQSTYFHTLTLLIREDFWQKVCNPDLYFELLKRQISGHLADIDCFSLDALG